MLRRLNQHPAPAAAPGNVDDPPADPAFVCGRLALSSETNFPVPGDGTIQRMATSLFTKVPTDGTRSA